MADGGPGAGAMQHDEFYIGYRNEAPPGLARRVRRIVGTLLLLVPGLAVVGAALQEPLPSGVFEFGVVRDFEGVLYETPVPRLRIHGEAGRPAASFLLVGAGKRGLPASARGHHGERVRLRGSLVYRGNAVMVEINEPGSVEVLGPPAAGEQRPRQETVGPVTVSGELVDTKCYLGVMRPGQGKVHRACAVRCLEGGIPPGLLSRDETGAAALFLLAGPTGRALELDIQLAGRQIEARGVLELHDDLPVLRAEWLRPVGADARTRPVE